MKKSNSLTDCSGLTIVSRYPIKEVEFNEFTDRGDRAKVYVDGEVLVRKGVGRIQIEPISDITVSQQRCQTALFSFNALNNEKNLIKYLRRTPFCKQTLEVTLFCY